MKHYAEVVAVWMCIINSVCGLLIVVVVCVLTCSIILIVLMCTYKSMRSLFHHLFATLDISSLSSESPIHHLHRAYNSRDGYIEL